MYFLLPLFCGGCMIRKRQKKKRFFPMKPGFSVPWKSPAAYMFSSTSPSGLLQSGALVIWKPGYSRSSRKLLFVPCSPGLAICRLPDGGLIQARRHRGNIAGKIPDAASGFWLGMPAGKQPKSRHAPGYKAVCCVFQTGMKPARPLF